MLFFDDSSKRPWKAAKAAVLNRINVATSRGKHRLILVGNAPKLQEMGAKPVREPEDDPDQSMTENAAPSNFVSQLLDHVQRHGKSLSKSKD